MLDQFVFQLLFQVDASLTNFRHAVNDIHHQMEPIQIVQQHGGAVTVLSNPGEGATFRLTLPRDRLPRPEEKEDQDD